MLITEKIEKIKKNIKDCFKGLKQIFLKINYPEAKWKIEKIKKNYINFFKNLRQFSLKFNDQEAISKQLTVLIKC